LGNLTNLERLRFRDNPFLTGTLPQSLTNLTNLKQLLFQDTWLCAPSDAAFQAWFRDIEETSGPTCTKIVTSGNMEILRVSQIWRRTDTGSKEYPAWSPDGNSIAHNITVRPLDPRREFAYQDIDVLHVGVFIHSPSFRRPVNPLYPRPSNAWSPTWSPDSRFIAYVSDYDISDYDSTTPPIFNYDIYVTNLFNFIRNQRRLTNNPAADTLPAWSPDGPSIAFVSNRDGNDEIYVMNAEDGTNLRNLTNNPAADTFPAWSPDGRFIAFTSWRNGNAEIYVMNADGSNQRRLTYHSGPDLYPTWSPDGRFIAFNHSDFDNLLFSDIYVINADGTNLRNLTNEPRPYEYLSWSPDGRHIAFSSIFRGRDLNLYQDLGMVRLSVRWRR